MLTLQILWSRIIIRDIGNEGQVKMLNACHWPVPIRAQLSSTTKSIAEDYTDPLSTICEVPDIPQVSHWDPFQLYAICIIVAPLCNNHVVIFNFVDNIYALALTIP